MHATEAATKTDSPEILIEDLYKSFGDQRVLQGIDLDVRRGQMIAIVGHSGCGKTVLLKHITGHLSPDSGRVLVADHEIEGSPLRDLATLTDDQMDDIRIHWAVVFQRNALLSGSVFYNLALWPREIRRMSDEEILPKARKAISDVGLDPDQILERRREDLSGGMAKRVAIARALVMDPVLLLYDEPTSGLDPESSSQIHQLIRQTHDSPTTLGVARTSVIVTHDTELLRSLKPRIVMMHEGKIAFDGSFGAFVQSDHPLIGPYVRQMPLLHERVHA